jgi:drug/metabolite transporter (DMT)-like permease
MDRSYVIGFGLVAFSALLYGSAYPFIKMLLRDLTVFDVAFYRGILASVTMVTISKISGTQIKPNRADATKLVLASAFGVWVFWALLNLGILMGSPTKAGFLVAIYPILTIALARPFLHERLSPGKTAAIMLGGLGVILLTFQFDFRSFLGLAPGWGDISSFLAAVVMAIYFILIGHFFSNVNSSPEYLTTNMFLMSLPPLIMLEVFVPGNHPTNVSSIGVIQLIWLGVLTSAAGVFSLNAGIKRMLVTDAAVALLMSPIINALLSYALLGDSLPPQGLLGGALILVGIIAANFWPSSRF